MDAPFLGQELLKPTKGGTENSESHSADNGALSDSNESLLHRVPHQPILFSLVWRAPEFQHNLRVLALQTHREKKSPAKWYNKNLGPYIEWV